MSIKLINGDCIEEMQKLIDNSVKVDMILTDPPYGTINGLNLDGWEDNTTKWDNQLPTKEMFDSCETTKNERNTHIIQSRTIYKLFKAI